MGAATMIQTHHGRRVPRPDLLKARSWLVVQGHEFPDNLFYDVDNQIWYEPLGDGTVARRLHALGGDADGRGARLHAEAHRPRLRKGRSFAVIEGGKWVGAARAAFDGTVGSQRNACRQPGLLTDDAFGEGWMLIVRPPATTGATALSPAPRSGGRSRPGSPEAPTRNAPVDRAPVAVRSYQSTTRAGSNPYVLVEASEP